MPGTSCRRRPQDGFTLIEVLLAIALVSIIMAMAYGGFRASVRATTSGEAVIEQTNRLRVVQQFVRRQLMQSRALIIQQFEDGEIVRFEGDRDRVRFVAPLPGYLSFGGPYIQELRLEPGERGMDLVFAYAMLNGYEPGDLDRDPPITLIENVDDLNFEYLALEEDGESVFWDSFWADDQNLPLPLAVSMRMALDSSTGLHWPDLETPVILDASGAMPQRARPENVTELRNATLGIRGERRERQ
ncbi:MAG: prepilin-type N-terminal cleavage/methylation domain-containing protein [Wenzhouxiangellaceae bacterium]|nr:prepilin-type N-terminal cleavage/methylation domain-containing protein [Wenzhouxiangellaceae bacterium]